MIVCTKCGHQNQDSATFCESCRSFLEFTGERVAQQKAGAPDPATPSGGAGGGAAAGTNTGAGGGPGTTGAAAPGSIGTRGATGAAADSATSARATSSSGTTAGSTGPNVPSPGPGTSRGSAVPGGASPGSSSDLQPREVAPGPTRDARPLAQPEEAPEPLPGGVPCPHCGTMNEPDRTFCVRCGSRLDEAPVAQAIPTASPRRSLPTGPLVPIAGAIVVLAVVGAVVFSQIGGGGPAASSTPTPGSSLAGQSPGEPSPAVSTGNEPTPGTTATETTPPPGHQPAGADVITLYAVRGGNPDVYIVNADGSGLKRLTRAAGADSDPAWSPDRTQIAFESHATAKGLPGPAGRFAQIWVMNADGSGAHPLTRTAANSAHATWAPDGSRIAFDTDASGTSQIWVMQADGSDPRQLTDLPGGAALPAWSPADGGPIAFDALDSGEIWAVSADGSSDPERLVDGAAAFPAWSPDGSRLAFSTTRDGGYQIYLAAADGTSLEPLTSGRSHAVNPGWSPDGAQIVFEDGLRKDSRLFIVDASGGDPAALLPGERDVHRPSWR